MNNQDQGNNQDQRNNQSPANKPRTFPISHQAALSEPHQASLRCLLGLMIPASARHEVPGADDPLIFKDLLASLGTQGNTISQLLDRLDALAGNSFAALSSQRQLQTVDLFRAERTPTLMALMSLVAQCYYRDDRVMRSLEMEVRPPFPNGYEVENGDWSLLDPVRARPPMYRDPP